MRFYTYHTSGHLLMDVFGDLEQRSVFLQGNEHFLLCFCPFGTTNFEQISLRMHWLHTLVFFKNVLIHLRKTGIVIFALEEKVTFGVKST